MPRFPKSIGAYPLQFCFRNKSNKHRWTNQQDRRTAAYHCTALVLWGGECIFLHCCIVAVNMAWCQIVTWFWNVTAKITLRTGLGTSQRAVVRDVQSVLIAGSYSTYLATLVKIHRSYSCLSKFRSMIITSPNPDSSPMNCGRGRCYYY